MSASTAGSSRLSAARSNSFFRLVRRTPAVRSLTADRARSSSASAGTMTASRGRTHRIGTGCRRSEAMARSVRACSEDRVRTILNNRHHRNVWILRNRFFGIQTPSWCQWLLLRIRTPPSTETSSGWSCWLSSGKRRKTPAGRSRLPNPYSLTVMFTRKSEHSITGV